MPKLFEENSDSDAEVKTNNEYAKNYEIWRKKEELNRLKTKYGEDDIDEDSSSSEDDEDAIKLSEQVEKDFFRTLSCLKKKDPSIYDNDTVFFSKISENNNKKSKHSNDSMYLKDYERKLLLESKGIIEEDNENSQQEIIDETYIEEQKKIKENLKSALDNVDESDNEEWGGLFKTRQKTNEEEVEEDASYRAWLAGRKKDLEDKNTKKSLKPLRDYWNNPNLDDGEKFLKDYILHKRFLDNEDKDYIPSYEEIVHDSDESLSGDENEIRKQEEFEHKYNFRFEEPDQEFIKRYPRTMEHSLRKQDDHRKVKRAEVKERKRMEKEQKFEEIKKLKELKLKEIQEKIEKLKEITGNDDLAFNNEDIDGDFDPEEHDKKMQAMFNEEYYDHPEDEEKPKFDMDDEFMKELETENYDNWQPEPEDDDKYEPHCDDEDFNMDADYDPTASLQKELIEGTKKRKKRKRKSKFVEMMSKPKPSFDPNDKTYEDYLEDYYKLDCEDIIDNIPCRFKYRQVEPNSFGLSIEEILTAKDRELNKWCSLKKAVQIRPDHVEKYDKIAYAKRGENLDLKKKILPSLFSQEEDQQTDIHNKNIAKKDNNLEKDIKHENTTEGKKIKESNKKIKNKETSVKEEIIGNILNNVTEKDEKKLKPQKKKNKKKKSRVLEESSSSQIKSSNVKNKNNKKETNTNVNKEKGKEISKKNKRKFKSHSDEPPGKKRKVKENDVLKDLSDSRLAAYGLNPKKFKNKLKYGKKDN